MKDDKMTNIAKLLALSLLAAILSFSSCSSPFDASGYGQVLVDFGGQSRGPVAPAGIVSIEIAVSATGMQTINTTLSSTKLDATLDVPAGKARSFKAFAKDSSSIVRFIGESTLDIKAGSTQELNINMVAVIYERDITSFSFSSPAAAGIITGTNIAVTVPFGTTVSSLTPTILSSPGSSVSPASGVPQDFSGTVNYTVTDPDANTQVYTVTVTVTPPSSNNNLSNFIVSCGALSPAFAPATISYVVDATSTTASVNATPTAAHPAASIQIKYNGGALVPVTSGNTLGALTLDTGPNTIQVIVTAEDSTTKTYTITVNKFIKLIVNAGPGGTVMFPAPEHKVLSSVPIQANPSPGYRFKEWLGTGGVTIIDKFSAITNASMPFNDCTLMANFEPDFAGGTGTIGDPYQIANLIQFKNMNYFRASFFKLLNNIDLIAEPNWTPIGDVAVKFTGGLDGNGFTISNMKINAAGVSDLGLFGFTDGAVIKNVKLLGISFTATGNNTGGLVGHTIGNTKITDCSVTGVISAYQAAGGLVGNSDTGSTLEVLRCSTDVAINSTTQGALGGLIGYSLGGTITQSYAIGNITETSGIDVDHVGGLVGYSKGTTIIDSYAWGSVTGTNNIGGLVGYNDATSSVIRCYSKGLVHADTTNPGGLIGSNSSVTITNCFYDRETSSQVDALGKGDPKFSSDMWLQGTFTGWDFGTVWKAVGGQYHKLFWQP